MPNQGVASSFKFGQGYGILIGVVQGAGFSLDYVSPQLWKKHSHLIGKDKDYSRTAATQRWPQMAHLFVRKKDANVADAALIAAYGILRLNDRRGLSEQLET